MTPRAQTLRWLVPTAAFVLGTGALGVTSKLALRTLRWQDLLLWVGIGYAAVAVVVVARGRRPRVRGGGQWAIASALLATVALISLYIGLASGPASSVVPVSSAYPAVTVALSAAVLSERLTPARIGGVCLVIAGVVLLAAVP